MITLPKTPGPRSLSWQLVDFGGTQQGALGGSAQRVNRLGNRWSCSVEMPVMTPADARVWASALSAGIRQGVAWQIRQVGTPTGSPGTPLVKGGAQVGNTLAIDGLNPGYVVRAGQWLAVTISAQRYLYQAAGDVMADGTGNITLSIEPALRVTPTDNAVVELGLPFIEGLLAESPSWNLDVDRLARGFAFTIMETR